MKMDVALPNDSNNLIAKLNIHFFEDSSNFLSKTNKIKEINLEKLIDKVMFSDRVQN